MRVLAVVLLAILATACSKADVRKAKTDASATVSAMVREAKQAGTGIKNDPGVRQTATDVKQVAKTAGQDIKAGAHKAGTQLKAAGSEVKSSTSSSDAAKN